MFCQATATSRCAGKDPFKEVSAWRLQSFGSEVKYHEFIPLNAWEVYINICKYDMIYVYTYIYLFIKYVNMYMHNIRWNMYILYWL